MASTAAFYVFNIGYNDGYVIASGDDVAPAILGYSDTGSVDVDNIPDNMLWWLEEYGRQIQFMRDHGQPSLRESRNTTERPAVPPLLTTRWLQTYPYNLSCPYKSNGQQCVTGCVATAMAQVLNYHRFKSVCQTTHEMPAYVSKHGISVDAVPAGSFIDWDNMVDDYENMVTTDEQKTAVANLMRYCGSSVQMDYSNGSSGARSSNVALAMIAYFNYGSRAKYFERNHCGMSDEEWEEFIYTELSHSRPVFYCGYTAGYAGHAFVCDGYDGQGFFHMNWGWGGSGGYYLLTAIDSAGTSLMHYSYSQNVVAFAEPRPALPSLDAGIRFADPIAWALCMQICDVNDDGALTMEEAAAVTSLGSFQMSLIYSFDEFQYFTGVTSISKNMFTNCENLTSITLHDSITSIGANAFNNCRRLKKLTIPISVTSVGLQLFAGCDSLKHLIWNAKNCLLTALSVVSSPTIERLTFGDSVQVIPNIFAQGSKIKKLTIGKSVIRIGSSAFNSCKELTRVVFPDALTTIGKNAFYDNNGLEQVTFGRSLTTIEDRAFDLCKNLTNISIPNSVTQIGMYAFYKCTKLERVTIGESVNSIGGTAFGGCESLKMVTCLVPAPPAINVNVFQNLYGQATLRVPRASVDVYKEAYPWNTFSEIVAIDPAEGDVNLDGMTDIVDVTDLIDQIREDNVTEFGDVNGDGEVNIADINALIDKILSY